MRDTRSRLKPDTLQLAQSEPLPTYAVHDYRGSTTRGGRSVSNERVRNGRDLGVDRMDGRMTHCHYIGSVTRVFGRTGRSFIEGEKAAVNWMLGAEVLLVSRINTCAGFPRHVSHQCAPLMT